MLARIRKSMDEKDQGFTLIELLVVIIIIGILAAIAIPVFLNQRKKAVDSSIKSDIHTVATEEETYYTDNNAYVSATATVNATTNASTIALGTTINLSDGNNIVVKQKTDKSAFCIIGYNTKGTASAAATSFVYVSDQGGLQSGKGACPSGYAS